MSLPHTLHEIRSQADAWRSALNAVEGVPRNIVERLKPELTGQVRFIGAGSSFYLGMSASVTWGRAGFLACALPASEQILHQAAYPLPPDSIAIAVSRSGTTTETLEALRRMRGDNLLRIGITTDGSSELRSEVDLVLEVTDGRETSIVQTRSFSGQLVASQALAFCAIGDEEASAGLARLADAADTWLAAVDESAAELAPNFRRAYVLGSGERWGLALEGALKLKETSLSEAEAFQFLEFRHGPQSMVDPETLIVGLVSERSRQEELAVLSDASRLGAKVLAIGEGLRNEDRSMITWSFESAACERAYGAMYLPALHLLAYYRSLAKGLDPDRPRHLSFSVMLDRV